VLGSGPRSGILTHSKENFGEENSNLWTAQIAIGKVAQNVKRSLGVTHAKVGFGLNDFREGGRQA
jgi:hypothetical protein